MALKPTIYKLRISLSDLDRNYYDTLNLTIAQHPSETLERMMARVLAYCINAEENLAFTKGLDEAEEPDIWLRSLDGQLILWLDLGEPAVARIKKATRLASIVKVYSFNSKSDVWWGQNQVKFKQLPVSVYRFQWQDIQLLAKLVERTMEFSVMITDNSAQFSTKLGECEVAWAVLQ
ncbi:MAG: YaeQ family protein [Gammaproteobacteria bacterium]|nr:YaeQ family protein [Gammaproteobacteria bacterium]